MYIPVNPDKLPNFWALLKEKANENNLYAIIYDGKYNEGNTHLRLKDTDIYALFKSRDYRWTGSNRMSLLEPHFSVTVVDDIGFIKELLVTPNQTLNGLNDFFIFIIDFIFLEIPAIQKIIFPLEMAKLLDNADYFFQKDEENKWLIVFRKTL